jgi:predicted N-formylglutamate amidohydrolase
MAPSDMAPSDMAPSDMAPTDRNPAGITSIYNEHGQAPILLVCEHASNFIPDEFEQLGLDDAALKTHIAWDIGALTVAKKLSDALEARLLYSNVSRLVYDCNRPPDAPDAVVERGETHDVPGNQKLTTNASHDRVARYYQPFREALVSLLEQDTPQFFITIHSFTPVYFGQHRAVDIGILHDADSRLADSMLACARDYHYVIRRNEPYSAQDGVTHTLKEHALQRGIPNVMLELKSSLLSDPDQHDQLCADLCIMLRCSFEKLLPTRMAGTM